MIKLILFTSLLFSTVTFKKCRNRRPPPLPCEVSSCYAHLVNDTKYCCETTLDKVYGQFLRNNHGTKKIMISLQIDTLINGYFQEKETKMIQLNPNTDYPLPCTHIGVGGDPVKCKKTKDYKIKASCFIDDPNCIIKTDNTEVIPYDCSTNCNEGDPGCTVFSVLTEYPEQRQGFEELKNVLKFPKYANYTFVMDIANSLSFGGTCPGRISIVTNDTLTSSGPNCVINFELLNPINIRLKDSTGSIVFDKFEHLRFDIPDRLIGKINRISPTETLLNFGVSGTGRLLFTTILMDSGKSKTDIIKSITYKDNKLIIQGEDFICFTLINID